VIDVAPLKHAVLDFFELVLGGGTATEDLGAFPAVRVDPACLITAFTKLTNVSHLDHDPSCLGLTEIFRFPGLRNPAAVVDLGSLRVCTTVLLGLSRRAAMDLYRCATQRSIRSVRRLLAASLDGLSH
jgi:hypothetical protein